MIIDTLSPAVTSRTPISFSYPKPWKTQWERIGNVHAIYKYTSKEGKTTIKSHIYQTSWVSDSDEKIPWWRNFDIEFIRDAVLLPEESPFPIAEGYNPNYYLEHPAIIKV